MRFISPLKAKTSGFLPVPCAFLLLLLSGGLDRCPAAEKNRFNLSDKPAAPRFEVTDKKWPEKVGEADLCLWHDDKLAALSLGVDDNNPGDIEWWKEQAALYDFKVTWFLITGRLDYSRSTGYWKQYRELNDLGHGVESHTVTHLHVAEAGWGTPEWSYSKVAAAKVAAMKAQAAATPGESAPPAIPDKPLAAAEGESVKGAPPTARPSAESLAAARLAAADKPATEPARGIEWEYAQSIGQIESNIPGKQVGVLAYPGGKNTVYNDRHIAAKYYRVVRGTGGSANAANAIDYMGTNAQSGWDFGGEGAHGCGNVRNILDPQLYKGRYYRGWAVLFTHNIIEAMRPRMKQTFEFIKENRDKLWVGLFADVAKYGQERDTATLKVESPGPDKITFLLTDEMDDSYFNFPLTVKVRIPNEWKDVHAMQGEKSVTVRVVEHDASAFALVQAVPDGGLVTIAKK